MRIPMLKFWLAVAGVVALAAGATGYLVARDGISYPKNLQISDFQSPLDAKLIGPLKFLESTDMAKFLDSNVLVKVVDEPRTIYVTKTAVEVTERQFPDQPKLHRIIADCARIMDIRKPRVFVIDEPGMNAYTCNMAEPIIVLHSSLLRRNINEREMRFIIGHEMGHIKCSHVRWHTAVACVRKLLPEEAATIALLPLFKWFRESEYSADNAGLICSQKAESSERVLVRLLLGLSEDQIGDIDIEEYLKQEETVEFGMIAEVVQFVREISTDHPFTPDRIRQLRAYQQSDRYTAIWERD